MKIVQTKNLQLTQVSLRLVSYKKTTKISHILSSALLFSLSLLSPSCIKDILGSCLGLYQKFLHNHQLNSNQL